MDQNLYQPHGLSSSSRTQGLKLPRIFNRPKAEQFIQNDIHRFQRSMLQKQSHLLRKLNNASNQELQLKQMIDLQKARRDQEVQVMKIIRTRKEIISVPIVVKPKRVKTPVRFQSIESRLAIRSTRDSMTEIKPTKDREPFETTDIILGKGKHGPVELIIQGGVQRALKRISKQTLSCIKMIQHVKQEKHVLNLLADLPCVVNLISTFSDADDVCFIFEYLPISLASQLTQMSKNAAVFYLSEILIALQKVHSYNVIYRDLKPDNVMLDSQGHVKLIDFGLSRVLDKDARAFTNCGTLGYSAPEVISGLGHSFAADIWSFGIMIGVVTTGSLPFDMSLEPMEINELILRGELVWKDIDNTVKHLLRQVLVIEPNLRSSFDEMKTHRFFHQGKTDYWATLDQCVPKVLEWPALKKSERDNKQTKRLDTFSLQRVNKEFDGF